MPTAQTQNTEQIKELFELGAHMGHKKSRIHPKARKNIHTIINSATIIDLTKTVDQLAKAKKFLASQGKEGKKILVVGTKRIANKYIREYAEEHNLNYISTKWLPGLLTNFKTIMKNVQKLKDLQEEEKTGAWDKFVKHERTQKTKEIAKLNRLYSGILNLNELPDLLLVVDMKKEKNAIKEAKSFDIPIVALADTNANPDEVEYPIAVNDDSAKVVEYILKDLLDAYTKNLKEDTKEEMKDKKKPA